ncbi:MAG: hypothetical protein ACE5LU_06730 [Anaerolineae bacterium]
MSTSQVSLNSRQVIARIDAIIHELESLRHQLASPTPTLTPTTNLTEQLFGALGQGAWDEYDLHLDWLRFSS